MKILFICSSNICRSPYCEYMLKKLLEEHPVAASKIEWIKSAAVLNPSSQIHPKARLALKREGFDEKYIDSHVPAFKWFDRQRFKEADIIVGMTVWNMLCLPLKYWRKYVSISTLATGRYKSVPDPYLMKDMEDYYKVMDILKDYLIKYVDKLDKE